MPSPPPLLDEAVALAQRQSRLAPPVSAEATGPPDQPPGAPLLLPGQTFSTISEAVSGIVYDRKLPRVLYLFAALTFGLTMVLFGAIGWLFVKGIGIWGVGMPVAWGFAITNFVWWIGIGHAGTLISAVLLVSRQPWRNSINRFAEAMTLFAVANAGLFPILHLGRPWMAYYILPYPNSMWLWPQFRSPLTWDVFAVSTYALVSLLFWYLGVVPDFATMRDRAPTRGKARLYGVFALGWRGSARHWHRYRTTYLLLGGLATPLVVSVHSIVALDFTVAIEPGWHSTIFPPYFVAGAIFSGFAMVLTLLIPVRALVPAVKPYVTQRHIDFMAKTILATGLLVTYGYVAETFMAWYGGDAAEWFMVENRAVGPYAPMYWTLICCNTVVIHTLWLGWTRRTLWFLWLVTVLVNVGMWTERYVIVVTTLHRDFLPSSWGMFSGTFWDWAVFVGTLGLFGALMFLFVRFVPMLSMSENRELVTEASGRPVPPQQARLEAAQERAPTASPYTHEETLS